MNVLAVVISNAKGGGGVVDTRTYIVHNGLSVGNLQSLNKSHSRREGQVRAD